MVTINGIPLEDAAGRWWVSDDTPEATVPSLAITSLTGPSQIGEIDAPSPGYGAALWPLVVAYQGADYQAASLARAQLEATVLARHQPLTIVRHDRTCQGMIIAAEPRRLGYGNRIDVTYQIRIPAGRWFDATPTVVELTAGLRTSGTATDGTYLLAPLLGGSRDMDPIITTTGNGSATNVKITDLSSGQWVQIVGNATPGHPIVVDPVRLTCTVNGVSAGGLLDFSPRPFHLSPSATVRLQRNGSNPVTITAQRAYT